MIRALSQSWSLWHKFLSELYFYCYVVVCDKDNYYKIMHFIVGLLNFLESYTMNIMIDYHDTGVVVEIIKS